MFVTKNKKTRTVIVGLLFITAALVWYSCKKNEYKNLDCSKIDSSYKNVIKPIVDGNCTSSSCHHAGSTFGDYTTYSGLQAVANNGQLNDRVLVKKNMPEGSSLSLDDRKKIKCWIDNGALNN